MPLQAVPHSESFFGNYPIRDAAVCSEVSLIRIPWAVFDCCSFLEAHCARTPGLFRVVGDADEIVELSKEYSSPFMSVDVTAFSPHSVSTFLKGLIGGMPNALIPEPHCFTLFEFMERYHEKSLKTSEKVAESTSESEGNSESGDKKNDLSSGTPRGDSHTSDPSLSASVEHGLNPGSMQGVTTSFEDVRVISSERVDAIIETEAESLSVSNLSPNQDVKPIREKSPVFSIAVGKSASSSHIPQLSLSDSTCDSYLSSIFTLLRSLPFQSRSLFMYLLFFLRRIAQFSDENMMGIPNLSLIFGPILIHPTNQEQRIDWIMGKKGSTLLEFLFSLNIPTDIGLFDGGLTLSQAENESSRSHLTRKVSGMFGKKGLEQPSSSENLPLYVSHDGQKKMRSSFEPKLEASAIIHVIIEMDDTPLSSLGLLNAMESVPIVPSTTSEQLSLLIQQSISNRIEITLAELLNLCTTHCIVEVGVDDSSGGSPLDRKKEVWPWRVGGEKSTRLCFKDQLILDRKIRAAVQVFFIALE